MNRSEFLKNTLLTSMAVPLVGSDLLSKSSYLPVESSVDTQKTDVKITDIKLFRVPRALFVKIETDSGISGWGEGDHDNTKVIAEIINSLIKPIALGQDPFQSEFLWHNILYKGEDLGLSGALTGALAGFDNALWDFKGKFLKMPVYKLLGGSNLEKIKVYGSFGVDNGGKSIKKAQKYAEEFLKQDYDTFKVRMQIRTLNRNPENDLTEKYVAAVREVIGDDHTLFVDFNNGYTAGKAVSMIHRLYEKYNINLVEEPVHYHDYNALAEVVANSPVRIAAGEHEFNRWDFKDLIIKGNADVLNLDVIKGGGISEMKKAAVLAQTFEREVMVHNARPTLCTAASLHLVASIFNPARVQEYAGPRPEMELQKFFNNYFKVEKNYIYVPQESGLGLEPNEEALAPFLHS